MQNMLILQKKEKSSFWKIWTRPLLLEHVFCMIGAVSWKKLKQLKSTTWLIYFMQLVSFYTSWKLDFLRFSGWCRKKPATWNRLMRLSDNTRIKPAQQMAHSLPANGFNPFAFNIPTKRQLERMAFPNWPHSSYIYYLRHVTYKLWSGWKVRVWSHFTVWSLGYTAWSKY